MRIIRPVFALFLALSIAAAALIYLQSHSWEDRIYIQGHRPSPYRMYANSSYRGSTSLQAGRAAPRDPDPYLQRYYSESEGWTYYTLPSYGSGRQKDE
jgi:hypothetical protein